MTEERKVVILGSGPAGYTAAVYTARANLNPLLFEGPEPGGQLIITTDVENFPGFPQGVPGPELMEKMKQQALRFNAEIISESAIEVDLSQRSFNIKSDNRHILTQTLIIATGATARWLNIPSERKMRGFGVSACATCDGFFFQGKKVMVVGGGDTAMEEATFLTRFASQVKVIHRRNELRASKIMQDKAFKNPKIDFIWDSVLQEIIGEPSTGVTAVKYKNVKTAEITEEPFQGVFIAIGHDPNTGIFKGQLDMDGNGYIITKPGTTQTNVVGIFAAGDVQDKIYRQAITAAGSGCMAALEAERFLGE